MRCLDIHPIARNQIETNCTCKVGFWYGFIKVYFYNYDEDLVLLTVTDARIQETDQCISAEIIDDPEFAKTIEKYAKEYSHYNFGHPYRKEVYEERITKDITFLEFGSRINPIEE